jgi:hypothetical protein
MITLKAVVRLQLRNRYFSHNLGGTIWCCMCIFGAHAHAALFTHCQNPAVLRSHFQYICACTVYHAASLCHVFPFLHVTSLGVVVLRIENSV